MATGHQAQASLEVQVDAASPFMSEPLLDSVTHTTVIGLGRCKKREGVSVPGAAVGCSHPGQCNLDQPSSLGVYALASEGLK